MILRSRVASNRAFTIVELLALSLMMLILVTLLLPPLHSRPRSASLPRCLNNLKQIGLAMHMYAEDNNWRYPSQVSVTNPASAGALAAAAPASYFASLNPYLRNPDVWICPTEKRKTVAAVSTNFANENVSYFLSLVATGSSARIVVAGDRHLTANGTAVAPGLFTVDTNLDMGWSSELHPVTGSAGCLLFADGHSEAFRRSPIKAFQDEPLAANRLAIP